MVCNTMQKCENCCIYPILKAINYRLFSMKLSLQKHCLYLIFIATIIPLISTGQNNIWSNTDNVTGRGKQQVGKTKNVVGRWKDHIQQWGLDSNYQHALSVGVRLHTNGWGGAIVYQKRTKPGQSRFYQLCFSEILHEKQVKQQKNNTAFPELGASSAFIFGKVNNVYLLQLGIGKEQLLLPGVLEGNISVSFRYGAGVSLGMLKPYYLRLIHVDYVPEQVVHLEEEQYTINNADLFLERDQILGASKWSKGLGEINYVPGAYAEGAFIIEPSKNKAFIQTVSLGGQVSFYTKKLSVMAEQKAFPYSMCLFVGLSIGKRWK